MTREDMVRLLKVPLNYIENFLTIRTKQGRLQKLLMKPAQRKLYDAIKAEHDAGRPVRILILKARQLGFSTLIEAMFFQDAATRFLVKTLIVAHEEDSTTNLFRMNKLFYDNLPAPLKPMRKNSNAQEIVFENPTRDPEEKKANPGLMSSIRCVTATGGNVGRGDTFTNVHASEAAFWRNMNETLDSILQAVPDDPDTAVVIESTPNGFNEFKTLWDDAVAGKNGFLPLFFPWFMEPGYRKPVPPGTEFSEKERELQKAYSLDDEQLMWRRWCIATNLRGDEEKFKQEYPSCPEEAFLTSGNPYFDNSLVLLRLPQCPEPVARGRFVYGEDENLCPTDWRWMDDPKGEIKLYALPEERVPSVLGGDTAGDGSDRFTGFLLDNTTGKQVAQLCYDGGSELYYAQQVYCLGRFYNTALLGIEINFSTYPERKLEEWGYPKLYIRERPDDMRRELDEKKWGWRTDGRTRPLMLANLRTMTDVAIGLFSSRELLSEMLTFIHSGPKMRPEAAAGAHDDLVMAAAICHQIREQQSYVVLDEPEEKQQKLIDQLQRGKRRR